MSEVIMDKQYVESQIPPGTMTVSFQGVSEFWIRDNHARKASESISELLKQCNDTRTVFCCDSLRLVIITGDLPKISKFWGKQTGTAGDVTVSESGFVAGKIFTWLAPDNTEKMHAIIILAENPFAGLVSDIDQYQLLAKRMIIHEFAHLDTEAVKKVIKGDRANDEWTYTLRSLATTCWAEFYAERQSALFCETSPDVEYINVFHDFLEASKKKVNQRIFEYRTNHDLMSVLQFATDELETLLAQLGRCLGQIAASKDHITLRSFDEETEKISPFWKGIVESFYKAFTAGFDLTEEYFDQIGMIAVRCYEDMGIFPQVLPDSSIFFRIPFGPENTSGFH